MGFGRHRAANPVIERQASIMVQTQGMAMLVVGAALMPWVIARWTSSPAPRPSPRPCHGPAPSLTRPAEPTARTARSTYRWCDGADRRIQAQHPGPTR